MISALVQSVFAEAAQVLKPPPKLSISEWAERERILSSESSATPGRYRVSRAPYQRAMQDAILDPLVEEVVFFTSAQIGKSLCLENILGYFVKEDPSPIIWMWQSIERAKEWSTQELAPMLRDTPALRGLVIEGSKKAGNTIFLKSFPGGSLTLVGANSAGALRSRKARLLMCDEVDAYPPSAGAEGDPILLIKKRQTTFWNRKTVLSSTCTIKNASRIEGAYEVSSKQKYWVPCPHCSQAHPDGKPDGFQLLRWRRMILDKTPPHIDTLYPCEHCGAALADVDKQWMLAHGEWRAERPEVTKVAGFWINELYSPFVTWPQMAEQWFNATARRENPELLKTFINLSLAETWEDQGETIEAGDLMRRRESYPPPALPDGVTVLTAGVDVQADRIEAEVVGFGKGEETWGVDWQRFDGDTAQPGVWEELDEFLLKARYLHARGIYLDIAATFVDSGFRSSDVYLWTQTRNERRIFATKGMSGFGRPALGRWNRNNRHRVKMFPLGVDVIKEIIYARLRIAEPGAGYMHFSKLKHDEEYFAQLTCEKLQRRYRNGFPVRYWEKAAGARNEVLDMRVLAHAAFLSLGQNPAAMLEHLRKDLLAQAKQAAALRRARIDPNQLALLALPDETLVQDVNMAAASNITSESVPAEAVQTIAAIEAKPDGQKPAVPKDAEADIADVSFGAQEYKVAEKHDNKPDPPSGGPARPEIRFKKSGWI